MLHCAKVLLVEGALSPHQKEFISGFREKLSKDPQNAKIETFQCAPAAAAVGRVVRGSEPLPSWLKFKVPKGQAAYPKYVHIRNTMAKKKLATVCQEAKCPNIGECWGGAECETATATIMLLGSQCTRACRFCSVMTSKAPPRPDPLEPENVASAVAEMGVEYVVLTMVDRDDLPDGGAAHVASCISKIKKNTTVLVECLSGDFCGRAADVQTMVDSQLDVYAHNVETVERLTPSIRDRRAGYKQSLGVLEMAKKIKPSLITKSSIMLGLGETQQEIRQTMLDLRSVGVQALTLGQYLQPSRTRMKVQRYAHPDEFAFWEKEAEAMGYLYCASGPLVRSSYKAGEYFMKKILRGESVKRGNPPEAPKKEPSSNPQ